MGGLVAAVDGAARSGARIPRCCATGVDVAPLPSLALLKLSGDASPCGCFSSVEAVAVVGATLRGRSEPPRAEASLGGVVEEAGDTTTSTVVAAAAPEATGEDEKLSPKRAAALRSASSDNFTRRPEPVANNSGIAPAPAGGAASGPTASNGNAGVAARSSTARARGGVNPANGSAAGGGTSGGGRAAHAGFARGVE